MSKRSNWTQTYIIFGMFAGIVAGFFVGWYFGEDAVSVKIFGDLFINALKAVIIPLIMASMICGVATLGDVRRMGKLGSVTLVYYFSTTFIAIIIGMTVSNVIQPGRGVEYGGAQLPEFLEGAEFSLHELILKFVPSGFWLQILNLEVLPLIISSLVFGGVLTTMGEKARPVIDFFEGINEAMMRVVHLIMLYAPIGVFGLIAGVLGEQGGGDAAIKQIVSLGWFCLTVITSLLVHGVIVIPILLKVFTGRSVIEYARNMSSAFTTAFTTDSSAATLPQTYECVEGKNKVSKESASFVLPLGATINMDGTALYEGCAALFVAQMVGLELTLYQYFIGFMLCALASVGAAAIPHAGMFTLMLVLNAWGLPLEAIGLLYSVDWFLDRCRTTVNVWGDASGAAVVDQIVNAPKQK